MDALESHNERTSATSCMVAMPGSPVSHAGSESLLSELMHDCIVLLQIQQFTADFCTHHNKLCAICRFLATMGRGKQHAKHADNKSGTKFNIRLSGCIEPTLAVRFSSTFILHLSLRYVSAPS